MVNKCLVSEYKRELINQWQEENAQKNGQVTHKRKKTQMISRIQNDVQHHQSSKMQNKTRYLCSPLTLGKTEMTGKGNY